MFMPSKTLGIALATFCGLGCVLGATACDKGGESARKASDRLLWVQSPQAGTDAEGIVTMTLRLFPLLILGSLLLLVF